MKRKLVSKVHLVLSNLMLGNTLHIEKPYILFFSKKANHNCENITWGKVIKLFFSPCQVSKMQNLCFLAVFVKYPHNGDFFEKCGLDI